jgi:aryl-alcohol dehydrogenase-like predicted oxidoreductase
METRIILPHAGLNVSRLCCGTMTFGDQTDEAAATEIVACCLDHGINFFDTANIYNQGAAETILGRTLQGRRDRVIVASKVAAKMGPAPDEAGLSRAAIFRAVEASLRRLQTDYLDIYYFHWPDYATPLEESLEAMAALVKQGKVRHAGASNYASWQVGRMLSLAERRGLPPVGITQSMYNVLARGIEQEFLPMCREFGLATVIYNPLAGGLLTGKQTFAAPLPGTRFDKSRAYVDRYWHEANFEAVQNLAATAQGCGRSLISLSLAWVLHHSPVDCVVLGASRLAQLQENLRAASEGPLPADAAAACNAAWAKIRGPSPQYNR